jgi:prepilin-type N-terminal cleavage/methylation domain-containing protein
MKKKYAFTLIEIMIAIVVFSVGVLAVLRVLT